MKRDNRATTLDRRQLLKSAVMGMATLPFASRALGVQAAADDAAILFASGQTSPELEGRFSV